MSQNISHDDVLAKMDALLKKHHDALTQVPVVTDFPLLTEVVEEAVEAIPLLTEVIESDAVPEAQEAAILEAAPLALNDEALAQLDHQIRTALEQRLPFHIVEAVDQALPVVLEEFAMQLENLVRDAVARELDRRLPELLKAVERSADGKTE